VSFARSVRGFSLIEVLIAALVVSCALVGFAHLIALGTKQTSSVQTSVSALSLAQSKLEALRALTWTFDAGGTRVSSPELGVSPVSSLFVDSSGHVDATDRFGQPVATSDIASAAYRRRWAVWPLDPANEDTLVLQVCVFGIGASSAARRLVPDACVSTIRTRKP
jgi:prepilin-type N-terminal cleavage/methylation domain-containing protein